jgi:hypothetical protein
MFVHHLVAACWFTTLLAAAPARRAAYEPVPAPAVANRPNPLIEGYAAVPETGLAGGIGNTDLRYPPEGGITGLRPFSEGIELHAWRGERVSAQLVLHSESSHEQLRFAPASVVSGTTRLPIAARFVRYTLADGKPQGDILDDAETLPLPAGANRPVWLTIDVPQDAAPGEYPGELAIHSDSASLRVPLRLQVLPATLPPPQRWSFHSWVENPLVATDFTSWPSGDCFLVYPGDRSSVRFERLRDGIESCEKIRLLRDHAAKSPTPALTAALAGLDTALADFTWARGANSGVHAADVGRVNAALLQAAQALSTR